MRKSVHDPRHGPAIAAECAHGGRPSGAGNAHADVSVDQSPEDARRAKFQFPPIDEERGYDAIEAVDEIARRHGASIPQIALAWLLAQPGVTSVIIGANKMAQLEDNLKSADIVLSQEEVERLSAVTAPRPLYPEWMAEFQNAERPQAAAAPPASPGTTARRG